MSRSFTKLWVLFANMKFYLLFENKKGNITTQGSWCLKLLATERLVPELILTTKKIFKNRINDPLWNESLSYQWICLIKDQWCRKRFHTLMLLSTYLFPLAIIRVNIQSTADEQIVILIIAVSSCYWRVFRVIRSAFVCELRDHFLFT